MPIVRERDGLAMSSRNAYLSKDERARAPGLHRALQAALQLRARGEVRASEICAAARAELEAVEARPDYVALVDERTLHPVEIADVPARLLIAALIGRTRLIDNIAIG